MKTADIFTSVEKKNLLLVSCVRRRRRRHEPIMNRPLTANSRNEAEMMAKAKRRSNMAQNPLEKFRCLLLARGATGILGFGR